MLTREQAEELQKQTPEWTLADDTKQLSRTFVFKNFVEAVEFINKVKDIAEAENHHPDLSLYEYRNLRIDLSTHAIGGLSENDFIVAAKVDSAV